MLKECLKTKLGNYSNNDNRGTEDHAKEVRQKDGRVLNLVILVVVVVVVDDKDKVHFSILVTWIRD
jgi:hypothetical protein